MRIHANPLALAAYARQSRRSAHDDQQSQRQHAEGQLRRAGAILRRQRQRPDPRSQRLSQFDRRLSQRRAGACSATSRPSRSAPENSAAFGLDEHDAGADRQHPAPARRQRHSGRRQHQEAAAATDRVAAAGDRDHAADRPHDDDPRLGRRTSSSSWRSRSGSSCW